MFNAKDHKEVMILTHEVLDIPAIGDNAERNYEELKKELTEYLDHLISTDFNKLIGILYRIDIHQERATAALANNTLKETPGEILANLIISRQLEKMETRKRYRDHLKDSGNKDFPNQD